MRKNQKGICCGCNTQQVNYGTRVCPTCGENDPLRTGHKKSINEKICSLILSTVLSISIVSCVFNFTGTNKPQEPQKQVLEAPILRNIRALLEYIDWSKWRSWGYHPRFGPN